MDLRNLQLTRDITRVAQPKAKRPAEELISSLTMHQRWIAHQRKSGEVTRIIYAGSFGVMRALRISPEADDFLSVVVQDDGGAQHQIVAHVSQCSFMFTTFTPAPDAAPEEKVIFGFAQDQGA